MMSAVAFPPQSIMVMFLRSPPAMYCASTASLRVTATGCDALVCDTLVCDAVLVVLVLLLGAAGGGAGGAGGVEGAGRGASKVPGGGAVAAWASLRAGAPPVVVLLSPLLLLPALWVVLGALLVLFVLLTAEASVPFTTVVLVAGEVKVALMGAVVLVAPLAIVLLLLAVLLPVPFVALLPMLLLTLFAVLLLPEAPWLDTMGSWPGMKPSWPKYCGLESGRPPRYTLDSIDRASALSKVTVPT